MKPRRTPHTPQFWTIFVFAAFCALGIVLLQSGKPADRPTAWICIGLFGSMTLLSAIWEVTRHWQGEGVRWQLLKIEGVERKVWFFPASKLQQCFLVAIMLIMSGTGTSIFFLKASSFQRWEMGIVGVIWLGMTPYFIYSTLTKTCGIALLPSGVLWLKEKTPLHIPWESIDLIATTRVAQDVGHGLKTHLPAIGIRLKPASTEQMSEVPAPGRRLLTPKTRAKLTGNRTQTNFELTYFDEALVISASEAARLMNFFLENPNHRRELQTEESQLGFLEALLRSNSSSNP
ncbi:hypothetical protein IAD21_03584 [Abditibacteriota bacterium]|nr:hypothetical protein IAD21_03584 [Abditibacteriota bacterium]